MNLRILSILLTLSFVQFGTAFAQKADVLIAEDFESGAGSPDDWRKGCLLYTSPSPRDQRGSRMPSSA